ncbi:hypothetical protein DICVIV_03458 [Dictyocaulus viviparus]|uniref:Chondroitin proteoglycan 4 domain-containing protein n=1 Tax=Dictyocaulus viviparus TaxID=29172 RepID=A0A0D8Y0J1_DICVI|nr:hypothetical protein DICVIV_03458 [Dictyocaulus viviparus]
MRVYFVFIFVSVVDAGHRLDKITEGAMQVLDNAHLDSTIRQCSCAEDSDCVKSMQQQARQCSNQCWHIFNEISTQPAALYKCVASKISTLTSFISCISDRLKSCVESNQGPQIPQVDIRKMFNIGEQRLNATGTEIINSGPIASIRPIAEAVMTFGGCVKRCFVEEKNANGFCYENKRCQPLITKDNLRYALRSCLSAVDWKSNAAELCECANKAGLSRDLKNICPLLRVVGG